METKCKDCNRKNKCHLLTMEDYYKELIKRFGKHYEKDVERMKNAQKMCKRFENKQLIIEFDF